ncbi:unnamed protein product [Allacma fusca]|uniref:Autophagy-related protein 9 n=1 Tax=Allacma fusca TaxID=39272 RepID=A0A8J2LVR3_9HEXA|nr:unnamed protein product [Allacma fusca]
MERTGYQSLTSSPAELDENPPEAQENDVVFHVVPDTSKNRWNHVEDLDSFFTRVYYYHQKHGFLCIVLQECFELIQFIFVVGFATFLLECVNYPKLFRNDGTTANNTAKITIPEVIYSTNVCVANFGFPMWLTLVVAFIFWIIRLIRVIRNTFLNLEIRYFYQMALGVQDCELDNLTWYDVQKRLREVQREQQMCIHKQELTELDIYHRILRFKNYMIAMMNKNLLPIKFTVPVVGEIIFFTKGLKYNLEMLLFWGPWAPFENNWHLKEDFKKVSKRKELAFSLANRILWVGLANLVLAPLIFLWQILYSFFNYAEVVKREPGTLGMRQWSRYGRVYLRHFNELEHEINGRLVRAYRPASKYMSIFTSPLMAVLAQNIAFIAGAVFAVLTALTIWDEDVITVEHVLLVITTLGSIMAVCRALIPDEHLVWCPEKLLTAVLAHVHYFPDHWKGQAHAAKVHDQFAFLFQYKVVYLIEELFSPVVTPFILLFYLRPKALEIVDFYRNFTVEVVGVGDVCSFAQMDVRKHGNPTWQTTTFNDMDGSGSDHPSNNNAYTQAENGKTELSLVHFIHTNPEWRPPMDSGNFLTNLKERATRDAVNLPTVMEENALLSSLTSMSSLGNEVLFCVA